MKRPTTLQTLAGAVATAVAVGGLYLSVHLHSTDSRGYPRDGSVVVGLGRPGAAPAEPAPSNPQPNTIPQPAQPSIQPSAGIGIPPAGSVTLSWPPPPLLFILTPYGALVYEYRGVATPVTPGQGTNAGSQGQPAPSTTIFGDVGTFIGSGSHNTVGTQISPASSGPQGHVHGPNSHGGSGGRQLRPGRRTPARAGASGHRLATPPSSGVQPYQTVTSAGP